MEISDYDLYVIDSFNDVESIKDKQYEIFISAYNNESMVLDVFNTINATEKIWLIFPDYKELNSSKYAHETYFNYSDNVNYDNIESSYINMFLKQFNFNDKHEKSICIDITGFIKPYMMFLILALEYLNFKNIDILYSEPKSYTNNEDTSFSINEIKSTRAIKWKDMRSEGKKNDLLFINIGYDHKLVDKIVNYYKNIGTHKILIGFPSLQPIMYQENMLNLIKSSENLQITQTFQPVFAAANDPFDTAKIINKEVQSYINNHQETVNNIFLAPLATKAQALGIVIFYIKEVEKFKKQGITLQIIYPFTQSYSSSSTKELAKINRYTLEF